MEKVRPSVLSPQMRKREKHQRHVLLAMNPKDRSSFLSTEKSTLDKWAISDRDFLQLGFLFIYLFFGVIVRHLDEAHLGLTYSSR